MTTCCGALEELSENMNQDFLPVLREYILYVESIQVRKISRGCLALVAYRGTTTKRALTPQTAIIEATSVSVLAG